MFILQNTYEAKVQFKYGDTWQHQHAVGDRILWEGNDIGVKVALKAKVYGILETDTCPVCNHDNLNNEYDIYEEGDVIRSVSIMKDIGDYFADDGNFKILE
ncbi:hypothetical protein [Chitinophaga caseinilytica]|uniref:hypothetical protein n=1 Tax=Chitinophaga caseinilytica TaxID=2267521 RepID=UPI003C2FFB0E